MNRFIEDIKKYAEYTKFAAKAELKSEVANSHLSWLWWLLDPMLFMIVYSFLALIVFGKGESYFSAFVFIGLSVWNFFQKTIKASVKIVSSNKAIVSKVYLPKYILVLQKILSNGFKMMISFALVFCMMVLYRVPVSYRVLYLIPLILLLVLLTFGFGTIFCHFGVFVEDLTNVTDVLLRLVFYLSGIFYSISARVADYPWAATILLKWNPVAFIINESRNVLLYNTDPNWMIVGIWYVISIVLIVIGVRTIYRYENSYVKVM
ncbi:MAG: ABC transporter permease [Lachnospiraceae bacterium]|nr:ABC transporter permease [Lachnospiraceae bacterium]